LNSMHMAILNLNLSQNQLMVMAIMSLNPSRNQFMVMAILNQAMANMSLNQSQNQYMVMVTKNPVMANINQAMAIKNKDMNHLPAMVMVMIQSLNQNRNLTGGGKDQLKKRVEMLQSLMLVL